MNELQQRSVELAKLFYAAKERHDLDATVALFSDDIVYTFPINASGEPTNWFEYRGRQIQPNISKGF